MEDDEEEVDISTTAMKVVLQAMSAAKGPCQDSQRALCHSSPLLPGIQAPFPCFRGLLQRISGAQHLA